MKQRFSSLDVKVISHELSKTLIGLRIHNIYDLSSRIFLLKFQTSGRREHFIVDSGFRCHLTTFVRTTAAEPSAFVKRLRKLLGTRRVTSVTQVGTDRIIEFQFSDGLYRLYLEFYAEGNIVVTDKELNVQALLRNVTKGAEHEMLKVGSTYNLTLRQNYGGVPPLTADQIRDGLRSASTEAKDQDDKQPKRKKKSVSALKKGISASMIGYPPVLLDHALRVHHFDTSLSPDSILADQSLLDKLLEALREAQRVVSEITGSETAKGYIISKQRKLPPNLAAQASDEVANDWIYDDFHPFRPQQIEDDPECRVEEIDGFNKTVDQFYSSLEGQKLDLKLQERELTAKKRLDDTRKLHQDRLGSLQQVQELNIRKAEAIQANVERVQEATAAVNGLIAQGIDWVDIGRLIETEQGRGNPVAQLVKLPLKLYENTVTLLLGEPEGEDDSGYAGSESESDTSDSDEEAPENNEKATASQLVDKRLAVDIDLSLSPWANASQYYDQKKAAAGKQVRTAEASTVALKNAERKVVADLKKALGQEKDILRPVRQTFWFEKFYYFLSSDGYLVLAGKDPSQHELLYSRHLKKGDVFVHADINGACPVVIKNNPATPNSPVPPSTLSQAGTYSVATSTAWDSKALMAPWWVNFNQVSKTSPNGDYLDPGNFHISGEKNYLPPAQLLVGVGIIFEISEESKARHNKHRIPDTPATDDTSSPEVEVEKPTGANDEDSDEGFPDTKQISNTSDSDEDFPDAVPQPQYDSDEDFPEAKLNDDSDSDSSEEASSAANPLQPVQTETKSEELPTRSGPSVTQPEEIDDDVSVANTETTVTTNRPGQRHLSAKERRLLKKGIKPEDLASSTPPSGRRTPADLDDDDDNKSTTTSATKQKAVQLPRGKRTKQKKAAAKYAEQDEEDRAAMLAKLGTQPGNDRKAEDAKARIMREQEALAAKQRRREQHLRAQALGKAQEQVRKEGAAADDEDALEEDNKAEMLVLERLVGKLLPGDEVHCAMPVCAPWNALATYKFKAKMQPGMLKKGKAAREVLGRWQADSKVARNLDLKSEDAQRIWPREAELLQGIKDTEVIAVMPVGKVRVMMAGGKDGGGSSAARAKTKAARGGKGSKKR